jgi:hypothetical protein
MRPLSAVTVIEVWERGLGQPPVQRALTLLSACTEESAATLPALTVGQRDARLAELYQRLFGETLHAFAECPQCGQRLEYSMALRDLAAPARPVENDLTLDYEGLPLRLRLPDSRDLAAAGRCATVEEARILLARRCLVPAEEGGFTDISDPLPDGLIERIAERLQHADPQAETLIHLTCAECSHRWQVVLDIERFLWTKVGSLAKRLLREVHLLARAYGWREADILSMTAARRQFYLEMVGI